MQSFFLQIRKADKKSDDTGNFMEFFNDFNQNTDGKFQREIFQMTLKFFKNFDQNSGLEAMQNFVAFSEYMNFNTPWSEIAVDRSSKADGFDAS